MDLVVECITKKFAAFSGRARRKEFWLFMLFYYVGALVLAFVDGFAGTFDPETGVAILSTLFSLVFFLPALTVSIRRLHDIDRSGWWFLIGFIPLIGLIVLIVFYVKRGTADQNRYGNDPLGGTAPATDQVMTETQ